MRGRQSILWKRALHGKEKSFLYRLFEGAAVNISILMHISVA